MASLRPVLAALALLLAVVAMATPLEVRTDAVDLTATSAGLQARVGTLDGWHIAVDPTDRFNVVTATLTHPGGQSLQRTLTLDGTDQEDRSRELAASLALLVQDLDDEAGPDHTATGTASSTKTTATTTDTVLRGWLGIGPRLGLAPAQVSGGIDVQGGMWLLRDHLQPLFSLGYTAQGRGQVRLHNVRLGAGLAAGAPLQAGKLWLGGYALAHITGAIAHERRTGTLLTSSHELGALLQVLRPRWLLGIRSGLGLTLPTVRVRGDSAQLRQGPVQWLFALTFGLRFG